MIYIFAELKIFLITGFTLLELERTCTYRHRTYFHYFNVKRVRATTAIYTWHFVLSRINFFSYKYERMSYILHVHTYEYNILYSMHFRHVLRCHISTSRNPHVDPPDDNLLVLIKLIVVMPTENSGKKMQYVHILLLFVAMRR